MKKLRPVLDGEYWRIAKNPDLGALSGKGGKMGGLPGQGIQQCVDHHVFKAADGLWHLWGCIRHTAIGRILYHWRSKNLTDTDWEPTGEYIRACGEAGEYVPDLSVTEEFLMSPFIIQDDKQYFMFYGAPHVHAGTVETAPSQMCLMLSPDGLRWTRHRDANGHSRVFTGPCSVRDPMVLRIDGLWHMYYAGFEPEGGGRAVGFYLRTSEDLIHWSEKTLVHRNRNPHFGQSWYDTECPFVAERGGGFYLFRTQDYGRAITHVFRSENPADFGTDDSLDHYVGTIATAATEIITDENGNEYVTSSHDLDNGTWMCRLKWVEENA